jgi:hypothetical protein
VVTVVELRDLGTSVVSVPAGKTFVHVLRSVIAAIASRVPMSFDDVDDLRLAVDEGAARLILVPGVEVLHMSVSHAADGLDVVLSAPGDDVAWPEPAWDETLTWKILTALMEQVRFERTDGAAEIRMFKRTSVGTMLG